jgi:3-methyladenine DNA glycosylase AlkD
MAKRATKKSSKRAQAASVGVRTTAKASGRVTAAEALDWLERRGTRKNVDGLARYGIAATRPFGVSVGELKRYAREIGRDHALAAALWKSGRYEARLLAVFVDEAERVTPKQMDAWARAFDNWALVDTACFALFDRAPDAWSMVAKWAKREPEFEKRTAFALIWSLSTHDRDAPDAAFLKCLPLVERAATDGRNFVKKAVDMALRAVGKRNRALNAAAVETCERLVASDDPTARWVGKHSLRELTSSAVRKRLGTARR